MDQFGTSPLAAIADRHRERRRLDGLDRQRPVRSTPGKWADIIAVKGDPLQDVKLLQHVAFVMKAGKVFKNDPQ